MGRGVRLAFAGLLGWVAVDLWVDRVAIFADVGPVSEPGLWILAALVAYAGYVLGDVVGWGKWVLAALALVVLASGAAAYAVSGTVWDAPMSWFVWGLDLVGAVVLALIFLGAAAQGTPGCEIGVVREMAQRRRDELDDDEPLFCLIGLRKLDGWERRMPWRRGR